MGAEWWGPISSIAAVVAALVAIWAVYYENRQSRRQLCQESVINYGAAAIEWVSAVAEYLGYVRHYIATDGGIETPWSLDQMSASHDTMQRLDREIKRAQMVCVDAVIQRELTRAGLHLSQFMDLVSGPYPSDPKANRERLKQLPDSGLALLASFNKCTETLTNRGFRKYAHRKSIGFRFARRRYGPVEIPDFRELDDGSSN